MSTAAQQSAASPNTLAPRIRGLLRGLRWRIRAYTLVQGSCLIVCWLVTMFWFALLCDYGPVWMGASEMPQAARAFLLIVAGAGAAFIGYRWILRRTFAYLHDHSMAILLERQHQQFHESLLTSVEMHEHPDHAADFNQEMLNHASEEALALAPGVRISRVFRWLPLWRAVGLALLLSSSIAVFAALPGSQESFRTAANRIVLLDDEPWKRMALLEVKGVTRWAYDYQPPGEEDVDAGASLRNDRPRLVTIEVPFDESCKARVASGSNVTLKISADITGHTRPNEVLLFWSTGDNSGRAAMAEGDARDGWLAFAYSEAPLKGINADVEFEALGYDFRTRRHEIEVVDQPSVLDVQLIYQRPDYLVATQRSVFKRVEEPLIAGAQVPRGSRVTFRLTMNKPLQRAYVYNLATKRTEIIAPNGDDKARKRIDYTVDNLIGPVALEWMLVDDDGLVNQSPPAVAVGVKDDQPPKVNIAVRGIGSAITPDAMFHLIGRVTDDYWLDRAWLEVAAGDRKRELPLPLKRGGFSEQEVVQQRLSPGDNVYHPVDFREQRTRDDDPLVLTAGDKITISVKAADEYDLDGYNPTSNPHAGVGDRYQLNVVTPDELLSLLERRELELRRRLETTFDDLTLMRDSLVRVKDAMSTTGESDNVGSTPTDATALSDSGEPGDKPLSPEAKAERWTALQRQRVQGAVNRSEQYRGETEGVGNALLDVVAQLENNRVDTEDRKKRLRDDVAAPLLELVSDDFIELDARLAGLNQQVNPSGAMDREKAALASEHAVAQADDVLLKLDAVLQKMVDMETFAEVLDKIRDLIADQDDLVDETKTLRKKQLFGLE